MIRLFSKISRTIWTAVRSHTTKPFSSEKPGKVNATYNEGYCQNKTDQINDAITIPFEAIRFWFIVDDYERVLKHFFLGFELQTLKFKVWSSNLQTFGWSDLGPISFCFVLLNFKWASLICYEYYFNAIFDDQYYNFQWSIIGI